MKCIFIVYIALFFIVTDVYASSDKGILSRKNNLELQMHSIKTDHGGAIMPVIDDISYTYQLNDKHSFEVRRHLFEVEKLKLRSGGYESYVDTYFLTHRYTIWSNKDNRITMGPALLTRQITMHTDYPDPSYRDNQLALSISWYANLPNDFFITFDTYANYLGDNRSFFDSEITFSRLILNSPLYIGAGFHFQIHRRDIMSEVATFRSAALTIVLGMIF